MEGLTPAEQKFFESGGQEAPADEPAEEQPAVESKPEVQAEVPPEKKKPSKFEYSADTDNVVDDLGRKYVPLGAVQEARNENKALKRQVEELSQKWSGGEAKLNALLEKLKPKEELPSFTEKPLEHLKAKKDELESQVAALREAEERRGKESEVNNQVTELQRNIVSAERAFVAKQPDYGEATAKVHEMWRAEYEAAGVPEELIDSMISRKGLQFSQAAMRKDQNPAEAVYKLAQRYGYKAAQKEENRDKDKLKTIAKGQEAEKSLATGKSGGDFGLEALSSMSDEEMDAFVADPKNWNKLSKAA